MNKNAEAIYLKALKACVSDTHCQDCPLDSFDGGCAVELHKGLLAIIESQEAEIAALRTTVDEVWRCLGA